MNQNSINNLNKLIPNDHHSINKFKNNNQFENINIIEIKKKQFINNITPNQSPKLISQYNDISSPLLYSLYNNYNYNQYQNQIIDKTNKDDDGIPGVVTPPPPFLLSEKPIPNNYNNNKNINKLIIINNNNNFNYINNNDQIKINKNNNNIIDGGVDNVLLDEIQQTTINLKDVIKKACPRKDTIDDEMNIQQ